MKIDTVMKQLMFTTVRISCTNPSGMSTGTGFIFNAENDNGKFNSPLLITNKHVIEGGQQGFIQIMRGKVEGGEKVPDWGNALNITFGNFAAAWVGHPNPSIDIAATPLGSILKPAIEAGYEPYYRSIHTQNYPTETDLENLDVASTVTFVGYPDGLYDTKHLTPIFRRGIAATPVQLDWQGDPCFLIDASVFPGSSGSPVFVADSGSYSTPQGITLGSRLSFLGIVASVHTQESLAAILTATTSKIAFNQMIDLGIVFNWRAVEETVEAACQKFGISRSTNAPAQSEPVLDQPKVEIAKGAPS